ncbi:hypothetical protein [Streptomyces nigrescens]
MTSNNASNAGRAQRAVGSGTTGARGAVTNAGALSGEEVDGGWTGVPGRCCGVIERSW